MMSLNEDKLIVKYNHQINEDEQLYDLDDPNCQPVKCNSGLGEFYGTCPICGVTSSQDVACLK